MQKIRLNEDQFIDLINASVKRVIREMNCSKPTSRKGNKINEHLTDKGICKPISKKALYNKIYKKISPYTSHSYNDEYWLGVSDIKNEMGSIDGIEDLIISPENGGYRTSSDGSAKWKEYNVSFMYCGKEYNGHLNCHACGSMSDPFSRYDMSFVLY